MKTLIQALLFLLLVTQICFAQWASIGLSDKTVTDIEVNDSAVFAVATDSLKLYRSIDNGETWISLDETGITDIEFNNSGDLFVVKDSVYNSGPRQLFISTDLGGTWTYLNVLEQLSDSGSLNLSGPNSVRVSPNGMVFCGYVTEITQPVNRYPHSSLARSTDNGQTWTPSGISGGVQYDFRGNSMVTGGWGWEFIWAAHKVYLSNDEGISWTDLGYTEPIWAPLSTLKLCWNGYIITGSQYGSLFLSVDSCNSWTQISSFSPNCGLSINYDGILVGTDSLGIFLFSDNGDSLGSRNEGLTNLNAHTLTADNNGYVYAGTDNGVWKRPLSEIVTSVEEETTQPTEFILSQNFPNPFNSSSVIRYSIPQSSNVVIKVFDVLGNEIKTLVNEYKPSGEYEIEFDAANFPSGVYFYQLKAGEVVSTKKMILLK